MSKKKFKLKKKFKKYIFGSILIIIVVFFGYKGIISLTYHKTDEYKLSKLGYDAESVNIILEKLDKKQINKLITDEKIDYIGNIISQKYFLSKNLEKYINYFENNSSKSYEDVVAVVNVGADKPWYEDSKPTDESKGLLILVNKFNLLSENYETGEIKKFSPTYAYGEVKANVDCYKAFINMADAARKDGVVLVLNSGYRTREKQKSIYEDYKNKKGEEYADSIAARPGSSEHETGLSLDIFTLNATIDMFHTTDAYKWLSENAQDYGFILRYPEGKTHITGYDAESWHYRYIGVEEARKVKNEGITYDEYYAFYIEK